MVKWNRLPKPGYYIHIYYNDGIWTFGLAASWTPYGTGILESRTGARPWSCRDVRHAVPQVDREHRLWRIPNLIQMFWNVTTSTSCRRFNKKTHATCRTCRTIRKIAERQMFRLPSHSFLNCTYLCFWCRKISIFCGREEVNFSIRSQRKTEANRPDRNKAVMRTEWALQCTYHRTHLFDNPPRERTDTWRAIPIFTTLWCKHLNRQLGSTSMHSYWLEKRGFWSVCLIDGASKPL